MAQTITVRHLPDGPGSLERTEHYDALVLSPGAAPIRPPLPGIDTQAGLASVRGKVEFYLLLLEEYSAHNVDAVSDFRRILAAGDRRTARRLIHTLKGVSGTLGISAVHRKAAELDQALKDDASAPIIDALAGDLEAVQAEALATIAAARPSAAPRQG